MNLSGSNAKHKTAKSLPQQTQNHKYNKDFISQPIYSLKEAKGTNV